jgi:hypothetical protein
MRVGLHARLTDSDQLSRVTTVVPSKLADAELPQRASAIVVSAALGHLSDAERRRLWTYVAESMDPGAPAVVGVLPPDHPVEVPLVRYRQRAIGDHVYEGWQSGTPLDEHSMAWTLIYRVLHGESGQLIAEYSATAPWRCDSVDELRADVARFGLVLTEHDDCVVVCRPPSVGV